MRKNINLFQIITAVILIALCILCLLPFVLLVSSSLTDETILIREGYGFLPKVFSVDAYAYLLRNSDMIVRAYANSILITFVGTFLNLLFTTLLAYPLSKPDLPYRNQWSFFVFFTMLFNGGVVSTYIMYTQYFHIRNTYFALLIPNLLLGSFYVIMMRSYFSQNIPEEVVEAARVDGAGEWFILAKIVLPMSKPIMATLALLVGLQYWNDWINGLYYLTKDKYFTIQIVLNNMLKTMQVLASNSSSASSNINAASLPTLGVKMAIAVIGILPILCIYPFFQRFFVKGITIGAVKG